MYGRMKEMQQSYYSTQSLPEIFNIMESSIYFFIEKQDYLLKLVDFIFI